MFSKKFEIGLLLVAALIFGGVDWFQTTTVSASENKTAEKAAAPEAPKFALMVGINNYKSYPKNKVRDLRGTNNDVELLKNLLVNTYGFKNEPDSKTSPIRTLLNSDATQQGIRDAFREHIIENAKKYKETAKVSANDGATVVFYYSGHGAKLEDDNGDESDGIDETIMPHDTSTDRKDNKDIRDDEFDIWFTELKNYTTNITFIFDSCHSGTVTRGGNNKSIERDLGPSNSSSRGGDEKVKDGMTSNIKEKSGSSKGGETLSRNESYVTISGSLPQEESQEDIFIDPNKSDVKQWDGALTYSMVHLLEKNPDITYREMIKAVQNKVVAMQKNQTPQAEGDIDRKMFGSAQTRGKTPIFIESSKFVTKTIGEGEDAKETELFEISMKVGSIIGAGNGAAVAVFAKKDGGKVREQIGSGMVVSSTEFDSKAEILLDDKTVKVMPKDAIINIISPSFTDKAERLIAFDYPPTTGKSGGAGAAASVTTKVFDYVRSKLDTKKVVKTVESSSIFQTFFGSKSGASPEWDFAVINGTYKEFKYGNSAADLKASKSGGGDDPCAQTKPEKEDAKGFFIVNRDGMPIYNLWFNETEEGTGDCLADTITKISRIENLRLLTSGESELNDQFKVEIVRLAKFNQLSETKCEITEVSPEQQAKDQTGAVTMKADDNYYLKVSNNSTKDLFVYIYSLTTNGKIALLYPPDGADGEKLLAGKSFKTIDKLGPGNCAAFYIEPLEDSPPGLETIKVIATTKPFPAKMLEQPSIARGTRGEGINALIEQAAAGARSGTRKVNVSDWTTKEINIQIVR